MFAMVDDILLHGAVHNLAEVSSLFLSLSLSLPALLCQPESLACVFGGKQVRSREMSSRSSDLLSFDINFASIKIMCRGWFVWCRHDAWLVLNECSYSFAR